MSNPLDSITEAIAQLTLSSQLLSSDLLAQVKRLQRLNTYMMGVLAVLGALVAFAIYGVFNLYAVSKITRANETRIEELQHRTNNEVLCPLYMLFLRSYNTHSENYRLNPKLYDESFKTIEDGAVTLKCATVTRRFNGP